jgi:hypothetical protein
MSAISRERMVTIIDSHITAISVHIITALRQRLLYIYCKLKQELTLCFAHELFCVSFDSQNNYIGSINSLNKIVTITEMDHVPCEVRTQSLYAIRLMRALKGQIILETIMM